MHMSIVEPALTQTRFWPSGQKQNESAWNIAPQARDLKRTFFGCVADGPVRQWNADGTLKFSGQFNNGILVRSPNSTP